MSFDRDAELNRILKKQLTGKGSNKIANLLALGSFLGTIAAIVITYINVKEKELSFSIESSSSLMNDQAIESNKKKIAITYDSIPITNLYTVVCKIENTGDVAIRQNDLLDSIVIAFDTAYRILSFDISTSPANINLFKRSSDNSVYLLPNMLNPKEAIILTVNYTGQQKNKNPTCNSRIADGEMIKVEKNAINKNHKPKYYFKIPETLEKAITTMILFVMGFTLLGVIIAVFGIGKKDKYKWLVRAVILFYAVVFIFAFLHFLYLE